MITEECHPEEVQAFATRGPADEGSMQFPLGAGFQWVGKDVTSVTWPHSLLPGRLNYR
jgi:hypothetical protein